MLVAIVEADMFVCISLFFNVEEGMLGMRVMAARKQDKIEERKERQEEIGRKKRFFSTMHSGCCK
jgi:hypothetical protein